MKSIAHVGMDVHKETTRLVVLLEGQQAPIEECTLETNQTTLTKYLRRWSSQYNVQCYYEAGICGYVPQRWLAAAGIDCKVLAPSKIPRAVGDWIKNDRRDARNLAKQGRTGAVAVVHVPSREEESIRSVLRCRETKLRDVIAAKHRILKFLRTRDEIYRDGDHWTQRHREWLKQRKLKKYDDWLLQEYLADLQHREDRLAEINRQILDIAQLPLYCKQVGMLTCFRGIDVLTAMTLITETIDFARFRTATNYMAYWGLTPREHSSGSRRSLGGITKSGSCHTRRIWVEAAWHYQFKPAVGERLRKRQEGQPAAVIAQAWKAQQRLYKKFWKLANAKDKRTAVVAVARELAGFVWGVMQP